MPHGSFHLPLLFASMLVTLTPHLAAGAEILLVSGPASHGPGEHRFPQGCALLAEALNASGLTVRATTSAGWPDDAALAAADTLVIYSDGLAQHVAAGHGAELRRHAAAGKGISLLHFAVEPGPGELADFLLATVGGRFETDWSVNPIWTMESPSLALHEVTRGVRPFALQDEWYFHLRFLPDAVPVLQALPPASSLGDDGPRSGNPTVRAALARGDLQTLAWVREVGGLRAFGFTGGHFHRNWAHDEFRRLVLNAIVWTAHVTVPPDGVASTVAPIPHFATIDQAIAQGDVEDVKRHLAANPASLHRGARSPALPPLHQAILRKRTEIALLLLEAGADPDLADENRSTPLHLAVQRGNATVVAALLAKQAEPDHLDQTGWTPLHHAAARDDVAIARALLDGGASVSRLSGFGGTPLHEAAASGGAGMIALLLERGVDPTVVSKAGVTALQIARERGNQVAIAALGVR